MPSYALAETQVGVDDDVMKKIANAVEIRVKERNGIIQQQKNRPVRLSILTPQLWITIFVCLLSIANILID